MEIQINDNKWVTFPISKDIMRDIKNSESYISDYDRDIGKFDMNVHEIKTEIEFWNELHLALHTNVSQMDIPELIYELCGLDINLNPHKLEVIDLKELGINHKSKYECYGEYYLREELWHLDDTVKESIDIKVLGEDTMSDNDADVIFINNSIYLIKF